MKLNDIKHGDAIGKLLSSSADGGVLTLKFALNRDGINFVDDLLNETGNGSEDLKDSAEEMVGNLVDLASTLAESLESMVGEGYEYEQFRLESYLLCRVLSYFENGSCEA